jgi:hypothetical protein
MQISEFSAWLRTQTNKHKRPFQEETIRSYAETARALDLWMAEEDIDGDFTACSVDLLNRFFSAYRNSHSQGGTNTRQRKPAPPAPDPAGTRAGALPSAVMCTVSMPSERFRWAGGVVLVPGTAWRPR